MKKKFFLSCLLIVMALLPAVAQIQDPVQFKTELKTISDPEAKMLNKYVGETAKASKKKAHKLNGGGVYILDGPQAVTYARLRKLEGGDYKRTERQRLVIKKLYQCLL